MHKSKALLHFYFNTLKCESKGVWEKFFRKSQEYLILDMFFTFGKYSINTETADHLTGGFLLIYFKGEM